jgi:hypothetical protein
MIVGVHVVPIHEESPLLDTGAHNKQCPHVAVELLDHVVVAISQKVEVTHAPRDGRRSNAEARLSIRSGEHDRDGPPEWMVVEMRPRIRPVEVMQADRKSVV